MDYLRSFPPILIGDETKYVSYNGTEFARGILSDMIQVSYHLTDKPNITTPIDSATYSGGFQSRYGFELAKAMFEEATRIRYAANRPVTVIPENWREMNQRRGELAQKKAWGTITSDESAEYERLTESAVTIAQTSLPQWRM